MNVEKIVGPNADPWRTPPSISKEAAVYHATIKLNVLLMSTFTQELAILIIPSACAL